MLNSEIVALQGIAEQVVKLVTVVRAPDQLEPLASHGLQGALKRLRVPARELLFDDVDEDPRVVELREGMRLGFQRIIGTRSSGS